MRGDLQQPGREDELVAPGRTRHRGHKQFYETRAPRRQAVHHTADRQRDTRSRRDHIHVPSDQCTVAQEHAQGHHARRLS